MEQIDIMKEEITKLREKVHTHSNNITEVFTRLKLLDDIGRVSSKLEERVTNWMDSTQSYRKSLCEKIEELKQGQKETRDILSKLPCDARDEKLKSWGTTQLLLWGSIGIVFTLLVVHLGWK